MEPISLFIIKKSLASLLLLYSMCTYSVTKHIICCVAILNSMNKFDELRNGIDVWTL